MGSTRGWAVRVLQLSWVGAVLAAALAASTLANAGAAVGGKHVSVTPLLSPLGAANGSTSWSGPGGGATGRNLTSGISAATGNQMTSGPLVGPLAVSGTSIVDVGRSGTPVVLRGVSVFADGPGPYPGGIVDANGLQTLRGWGANFVRLQVSSTEILQNCGGQLDSTYLSDLASTVGALTGSGIFVLLDIHQTDPNCAWSSPQSSNIAPLAGEDAVPALDYLAKTYGSNPLVGFEPFNEPEACALASTGPGASIFQPSYEEPNGVCTSQVLADLAWANPGTAEAAGSQIAGVNLPATTYATPGMDALYQAVMSDIPAGHVPLVFMDANYFASDPATFDQLGTLAGAGNIVEAYHPYDCQDTSSSNGNENANCADASPETCATVTQHVSYLMTDGVTKAAQNRPVVFDEMNFPAGETLYQSPGPGGVFLPINLYQHGLWVNNVLATMQAHGAAGWAIYYFQNADVDGLTSPYSMVASGITASTPVPWPVSANDAPAVSAMQGQPLACQDPPVGYDSPMVGGSPNASPLPFGL